MTRGKLIAFVFVVTGLLISTSLQANYIAGVEQPKPYIIKGLVTIQFEDDVDPQNMNKGFGLVRFGMPSLDKILDDFQVNDSRKLFPWRTEKPPIGSGLHDLTRFYEITFPEAIEVGSVVEALLQNPNIRNAEPVWALPLLINPDDPEYFSQWHMSPAGNDPHVFDAWDLETGSDSIKLALIDSGVNYKHPDLKGNIWVNPGEDIDGDGVVYDIDDMNGIDDDGNGVTDDLIGYDFFTGLGGGVYPGEDGGGTDNDPNDFNGHGTHCAGIADAMVNNATDVTGVAGGWFGGHRSFRGARIICLRVGATGTDGNGYVNSNNCGTAIDYAANNGAHVISASWGSSQTSTMIQGMANAALNGVNIMHAAGNESCDCPDYLDFDPATNVLSIASTTSSDARSSFSNFGSWIDVSAPGSSILSTNSYQYVPSIGYKSGTSMAAPMVAGQALLIRSVMPSLSKEQVDSLIMATADNIDLQNPVYVGLLGAGRINVYNSIKDLPFSKFTADVTEGSAPLQVQFTDLSPASPDLPTAWDWNFGTGDISTDQSPTYTFNDPGIYDISLLVDVNNPLGLGEEHLKRYIWVRGDTLSLDSAQAKVGEEVVIPVYLSNTSLIDEIIFAFKFETGVDIDLDSFSTAGLRTDYFHSVTYNAQSPATNSYSIRMQSSNKAAGESIYLQPGSGDILNLYFSIGKNGDPGDLIVIDTATVSFKKPNMISIYGDYFPIYEPGKIFVKICPHGDSNCDDEINISDLTALVEYLFNGGSVDRYGGDVNGDGSIFISDITYLVEYLFNHGPPPPSE